MKAKMHSPNAALRQARMQRGWSQADVAEQLGTNAFTVSRWERGQATPTPHYRQKLCTLFGLSLEDLGLLSAASLGYPHPGLARIWSVPLPRNPFFTGREALLEQLDTLLRAEQRVALTQPYALSGLGGIGKTQLALEYAYRHAQAYTAILWVRGETEQALLTDIAAIAALLSLPEQAASDQQHLLAAVSRWLAEHRDWLLIVDNLEEATLLQRLLPTVQKGAVLLTTRRHALGALAQPLDVDRLSPEEGVQFLLRRARRLVPGKEIAQEDTVLAHTLVEALDGLPLALDQAGAYLEETGCSLATYLQLYQQAPLRLLSERGSDGPHPDSVTRTFGLAAARLAAVHPEAAVLVQLCAFLAPEAIPEELLKRGMAAVDGWLADSFQFQAAVKEALAYALLRRQTPAGTFTMHRLVQAVVRAVLGEAQQQWAEWVVRLVAAAFPDPKDYATWEECQRLLPHALVCAGHLERWGFLLPEGARLLDAVGYYLRQRASYQDALPLQERALAMREQMVGPVHPEVAESLNNLAAVHHVQGRYAEALPLYQRALEMREQMLGPAHQHVAQSLNNLAFWYHVQGRYQEALPLYQRAVAIFEQVLGPDHPDVATSLSNLADLYVNQGQDTEALLLMRRALSIREQALGPNHPDVAISLGLLAELYCIQGRPHEALSLAQQSLAVREQALGPNHPDVAFSLHTLAGLHHQQGQVTQALALAQRALSIREQVLGKHHPDVAQSLTSLAALFAAQGQYTQALALVQRALSIREQVLGASHPRVAESLEQAAHLRRALHQQDQMLAL